MDYLFGCQWRWVTNGTIKTDVPQGICCVDLSVKPETEGVVEKWLQRHGVHAALVRPDHYVFASAGNAADANKLFEIWRTHLN